MFEKMTEFVSVVLNIKDKNATIIKLRQLFDSDIDNLYFDFL